MASIISLAREHRYSAQVTFVALLVSVITFATMMLAMSSSPWHITWMMLLPLALGIVLNRGEMRWLMAPVLLVVAVIATTVVGYAMGGI